MITSSSCAIFILLLIIQHIILFRHMPVLPQSSISLCLTLALLLTLALAQPVEIINWREYEGRYVATQPGKTFDYLDGKQGRIIMIFYGEPNKDIINSVDMFFMDPYYQDSKVILLQIKGIVNIGNKSSWTNTSHALSYTSLWKERQDTTYDSINVATEINFKNLETEDYEQVEITLSIKGANFQITASLTYFDQVISTLAYSLYATALVGIQIYCGFVLLKIMDAPNFVFSAKISLLTLSLCNIEDFSQTMSHIQYIMSSESGYLFFIIPALAYIVLFIIFDMKMLFLVWRSHNLRTMENPQQLRKKLTSFYIQFYLGLFLYLTLTYFFSNDQWMIVLRNLILIPQIIHNVRLGNNPGFKKHYIFGFIGTRLLLPVYQRLCPNNRFLLTPSIPLVVGLFGIYALQIVLLYLQSRLGSRFFVPKRFQPNYYNYKTKLIADETNRQIQCTICLQNIFEQADAQSINPSSSILTDTLLKEATVMNTPCNHKFHEECLKQWLQVKLQCPTCRADLPPI